MAKFMKVVVGSTHEYFNTNNIVGTEKQLSQFLSQIELVYPSVRSSSYKLQLFSAPSNIGDYFNQAIMNANSSSHTNNVYDPELTQGKQPTVSNVS